MVEILKCNLVPSGTPFEVKNTLKDDSIVPESIGYTSLVDGPDRKMRNIVFQKAIMLRRGKDGKPMISSSTILTPVFQLPNNQYPKSLFPEDKADLNGLVDVETYEDHSTNLVQEDNIAFMGWLLARTNFAYKLTKVTYPGEHAISSKLGLGSQQFVPGGGYNINAWPKRHSPLSKARQEIESHASSGEFNYLADAFCGEAQRVELLRSLQEVEARSVIPKLEYQRRMCVVMKDALDQISKAAGADELEDKEKIFELVKNTRLWVKTKRAKIVEALDGRVDGIRTNRKLLKL